MKERVGKTSELLHEYTRWRHNCVDNGCWKWRLVRQREAGATSIGQWLQAREVGRVVEADLRERDVDLLIAALRETGRGSGIAVEEVVSERLGWRWRQLSW